MISQSVAGYRKYHILGKPKSHAIELTCAVCKGSSFTPVTFVVQAVLAQYFKSRLTSNGNNRTSLRNYRALNETGPRAQDVEVGIRKKRNRQVRPECFYLLDALYSDLVAGRTVRFKMRRFVGKAVVVEKSVSLSSVFLKILW